MESHACNLCQSSIQGMAYRTDCHHLLCPSCAQSSLQSSHSCPTCATYLKPENISEVMIGLKIANIADQLFQHVLSGEGIHEASTRMESIFQTLQDISAFISVQLSEQSKRWGLAFQQMEGQVIEKESELAVRTNSLMEESELLRRVQAQQELQISDQMKEISQLQGELKETARKCQAWEKAYGNVRTQLFGQRTQQLAPEMAAPAPSYPQLPPQPMWTNPAADLHSNAARGVQFAADNPFNRRNDIQGMPPQLQPEHARPMPVTQLTGWKRTITTAGPYSSDRRLEVAKLLAPQEILPLTTKPAPSIRRSSSFFDKATFRTRA